MAHPSNPRLMNRVVDAVLHLGEGKGSTARDVLDFLRYSSRGAQRNLTMQVHRALKHAVNAGLLRHRSGRYKALFTLNPAPVKQPVNETNDEKSVGGPTALDVEHEPSGKVSSDRKETTREKRKKPRHGRKHKRSRSRSRRRRHRSESSNSPTEDAKPARKYRHKDNGQRDRSPRRRISDGNAKADIGSSSLSRRRGKTLKEDADDYSSDLSNSDYEDRKPKGKKHAALRHECRSSESGKASRRSCSRNRSPQRQKSPQPQPKRSLDDVKRGRTDAVDDRGIVDQNDLPEQDMENARAPDNSSSGSTL